VVRRSPFHLCHENYKTNSTSGAYRSRRNARDSSALTRSGYVFQEFNIPFANHYIEPLTDVADEVVGAWRNGTARAIPWDSICEDEQ